MCDRKYVWTKYSEEYESKNNLFIISGSDSFEVAVLCVTDTDKDNTVILLSAYFWDHLFQQLLGGGLLPFHVYSWDINISHRLYIWSFHIFLL